MANRRLIDKNFILSDSFTNMTSRTQLLYIRLLVSADDEGFVSNIKMLCQNKRSLNALIKAGLLHQFDTGCVLILHWFVHNSIRKDRAIPTQHIDEKALVILDKDRIYRLVECGPNDNQTETQYKINKDNINKYK